MRVAEAAVEPSPEPSPGHPQVPQERLPIGPLVYRRRLRAALEAEIGRLYLDTLAEPIPPRLMSIVRRRAIT